MAGAGLGGGGGGRAGARGGAPGPPPPPPARACVGSEHLLLDPEALSVRFARPGVELDLGGIGKGVAVDRAVKTLKGLGVESALLHAGTSSVCAIGRPPGGDAWPVAIRDPEAPERSAGTVRLCNAALSVSGAHGRFFEEDGERYGHVMDPRTGGPSQGARQAAVVHPSATVAEGLSTALLVAGAELLPRVRERWPEAECRLL